MNDTSKLDVGRYPVRVLTLVLAPFLAIWGAALLVLPMEMKAALVALVVMVGPLAFVVLRSSERAARRWAAKRGAEFTPPGIDQLRRHLMRTRVAVMLGVTIPLAIGFMLISRYNAQPETFPWYSDIDHKFSGIFMMLSLGYVVGVWWAEATKPRDRLGSEVGSAVILPRRLRDYLDRAVSIPLIACAVIALLAIPVYFVVSVTAPGERSAFPWFDVMWPLPVAVLALVLAIWACRKRESGRDEEALAYEELTRTATVNALCGTAVGMLGWFVYQLLNFPYLDSLAPSWVSYPSIIVWSVAYVTWLGSGTRLVFSTRRIQKLRARAQTRLQAREPSPGPTAPSSTPGPAAPAPVAPSS